MHKNVPNLYARFSLETLSIGGKKNHNSPHEHGNVWSTLKNKEDHNGSREQLSTLSTPKSGLGKTSKATL